MSLGSADSLGMPRQNQTSLGMSTEGSGAPKIERGELRQGGEDVAADFAALQIAKQNHRELVGLEP